MFLGGLVTPLLMLEVVVVVEEEDSKHSSRVWV